MRKKNRKLNSRGIIRVLFLFAGLILIASQAMAQQAVTGQVTTVTGEPVPGATVVLKGTSTGTVTDGDGNFTIQASNGDVLVISFIGMKSQEISYTGQSRINVTLEQDVIGLEEVVAVGYGTVKKSDLTGSVSSVKSEDFNPGANTSVEQLIQGKVAGAQISQSSGEPGGGLSIKIRGVGSINAGISPLYVIDGVPIDNSPMLGAGGAASIAGSTPRNPLNTLNVNDIESIEILKDASATAIYGSRAANGIVLITTKKGTSTELQVEYNLKVGNQTVEKRMDLLSSQQYMDVLNEISRDRGEPPIFSEQDKSMIGPGTDWQDQLFRSAIMVDNNIAISGGSENTTYRLSLNHLLQDGIVKNSGIESYTLRTNFNTKISERIESGLNFNFSKIENNNHPEGSGFNETSGPINSALLYDPTEPVLNEDGSFSESYNLTINNPVSLIEGIETISNIKRFLGNSFIRYNLNDLFSMKLNIGFDVHSDNRNIYNSSLTLRGGAAGGIANKANLEKSNILIEYTADFNHDINENNKITILGGTSYQKFNNESFAGTISRFPTDNIKYNNFSLGDIGTVNLSSNKVENKLLSYFGRLNYRLFDRYLLTGTIRADGSSRFGENNRFGIFPSLAVAWNIANEKFMPSIFEEFKIRSSWGMTGNQEIGNNQTQLTFVSGADAIFDDQRNSSLSPSRVANPNLKWEKTEQYNVGLDVSLWENRFRATVDYFNKITNDMLIRMPLPPSSGFGSKYENLENAEIQNKGIELTFNTVNITRQDFHWNSSISFTTIKNTVKSLGGASRIFMGSVPFVSNTSVIQEGSPLGSYYGYKWIGIFQQDDDIANSSQPDAEPGFPIIFDANGDGAITDADRVILGNPLPDFVCGIQNRFSYKGLSFEFFIEGVQGVELFNMNAVESLYPVNFRRNRYKEHGLNRWTPENPNTKYPSGTFPSAYGGNQINSLTVQDASYIRLKNVTLNYQIPQNLIRNAAISLTVQNLITITDYNGFNPEANVFGNSITVVDYNAYPLSRTVLLGINLGF
jgi:TonB-dependent starch-binding outer membrane protein SusC